MDEILSIATKLSGVSLASLLIVILVTSKKGVWLWGEQLDHANQAHAEERAEYEKRIADYERRLAEQRTDSERRIDRLQLSVDRWQQVALSTAGVSDELTRTLKDISK